MREGKVGRTIMRRPPRATSCEDENRQSAAWKRGQEGKRERAHLEAEVEATEAVADDEEQAVRAHRVLVLRQERRVEAERESDLGRAAGGRAGSTARSSRSRRGGRGPSDAREEVGLLDGLVEGDERLEDLGVVLVEDVLLDVGRQLLAGEDLGRLEAGVRQGRAAGREGARQPLGGVGRDAGGGGAHTSELPKTL